MKHQKLVQICENTPVVSLDKVGWIVRKISELGGYGNVSDSVKTDIFGSQRYCARIFNNPCIAVLIYLSLCTKICEYIGKSQPDQGNFFNRPSVTSSFIIISGMKATPSVLIANCFNTVLLDVWSITLGVIPAWDRSSSSMARKLQP